MTLCELCIKAIEESRGSATRIVDLCPECSLVESDDYCRAIKHESLLPSHRLDYISKFKEGYVDQMNDLRSKFIFLDAYLFLLSEDPNISTESIRTLEIARTHLETACQFGIKTVCLLGEEGRRRR